MEKTTEIGQRIRKIMENLTLQEFADSIGVSVRALSNYLNGRMPKKSIIKNICDNYGVSSTWLRSGEGPMYASSGDLNFSDTSEIFEGGMCSQPIENTKLQVDNFSDMSEKLRLRQKLEQSLGKILELQERLLALTEQNAELRIRFERLQIDIDRRDQRIRELENENAQLREARKGVSPVFRAATGEAN